MKYVLIWILFATDPPLTETVDFTSDKSCQDAKSALIGEIGMRYNMPISEIHKAQEGKSFRMSKMMIAICVER